MHQAANPTSPLLHLVRRGGFRPREAVGDLVHLAAELVAVEVTDVPAVSAGVKAGHGSPDEFLTTGSRPSAACMA